MKAVKILFVLRRLSIYMIVKTIKAFNSEVFKICPEGQIKAVDIYCMVFE